ncbi:putative signal transducing protein [Hymenobacter guriensis]|uniref:DUF2007 domain-containing protein n=1 Tax=Hymenobacter guriensis TaxID=2793065 RepID=A0ABS0L2D9_9BACT|nr:DUF2007 domain-containing protein [Hymenobacter guriensis]MBG8554281.1 DUF2007 domain-containing protein [Hymenobacter guriensis]
MPSEPPSSSPIVLVATFADGIAAHLAKNQLEAAGIPCFLSNEHRPYSSALDPVRLHVRQPDLAAAQVVLQPAQALMHALPPEDETATETVRCTRCQHSDVVCRQHPQPTDTLLTRLRLWFLAPERPLCHCFHCGHDFEG